MSHTTVEIDVSDAVPIDGTHHVSTWVFPPSEPSCDHHGEARGYASSSDITLFILPTSAHCHNSASTRVYLWNRLAQWVTALDH